MTIRLSKKFWQNFILIEIMSHIGVLAVYLKEVRNCCSDMALSGYGFFRTMQHFFKDHLFKCFNEVEEAFQVFFDCKEVLLCPIFES